MHFCIYINAKLHYYVFKKRKKGMKMSWNSLINELIESGMTEKKIAEVVGSTTQSTIHRIKSGAISDPRYRLGKQLKDLHESIRSAA